MSNKTFRLIAVAFLAACVMKVFFFDFMMTEGHSMLPAIKPGTVLFVNKLYYGFRPPLSHEYLIRWGAPAKGDIVIFYTPAGDLAVKRCTMSEGGHFFAAGDNPLVSLDSWTYGLVPIDNIIGKVLGVD